MKDEWKDLIQKAMQDDVEKILEEVNADPYFKDLELPEEVHDRLMAQIREYEDKRRMEQLSEEDREWIRLGKVYKRKQKWNRYIILAAAMIMVFAIGTVSMGEGENVLSFLKQMIAGEEQTVSDSGSTEPIRYVKEEEVYEKVKNEYGFMPVTLDYLPPDTEFKEAVFGPAIQAVYMYYGEGKETDITYIIRPNYRESSFATVIEDEPLQEYMMIVNDTKITLTEYNIVESRENRWSVCWIYQEVQYMLNITDVKQDEVEKVVNLLGFHK